MIIICFVSYAEEESGIKAWDPLKSIKSLIKGAKDVGEKVTEEAEGIGGEAKEAEVGKEKFGLDVKIQRLENPRVEADTHPLEVVSKKLPRVFGFTPQIKLKEEIERIFEILLEPHIKNRIEMKKHTIMPVTTWQGEKREMRKLERPVV